jgi:Uma2 family endonuclease
MAQLAPQPARITAIQYAAMPETTLPAQLIDGEIVALPSPKIEHQRLIARLHLILSKSIQSGELCLSPLDVHIDQYNVVQPDIFWVSGTISKCQPGEDGYWHGAPDFVIEVLSPATHRVDRREKFSLYEQYGTREYWLVDPDPKIIEVWAASDGRFERVGVYGPEDTLHSTALHNVAVTLAEIFVES